MSDNILKASSFMKNVSKNDNDKSKDVIKDEVGKHDL